MKSHTYNNQNLLRVRFSGLLENFGTTLILAILSFLLMSVSAVAAPVCNTLYAGQTINSGTLCIDNNSEYLTVTYNTNNGWTLNEVHLFVGNSLAEMPQTKTGNPKNGNFPFTDNASGATSYTFKLPLGDFQAACGTILTMAAHAAVSRKNADGTVSQETAWGAGTRMVAKGNWATYFNYTVQCPPPPPTACKRTETAFAFGDQTFADVGLINDKRWGWQVTANAGVNGVAQIYAGAGGNDITKGTLVGTLNYLYSGGVLYVNYLMNSSSYTMLATHLYAKDVNITTSAPGKYGNLHVALQAGTISDTYTIPVADTNGDGIIFIVAHAEVCFK